MILDHRDEIVRIASKLRLVYHVNTPIHGPSDINRLKVDLLGTGQLLFLDMGVPGSDQSYTYRDDGLLLFVQRPQGAGGPVAQWAQAILPSAVETPPAFLLTFAFNRPKQTPIVDGNWAATLFLGLGTGFLGATCQFRFQQGIRLNLVNVGFLPDHAKISDDLASRILDRENPATVTLALWFDPDRSPNAKAFLYVDEDQADSIPFDLPPFGAHHPMTDIRSGIATVAGDAYTAGLFLLDFRIYLKT